MMPEVPDSNWLFVCPSILKQDWNIRNARYLNTLISVQKFNCDKTPTFSRFFPPNIFLAIFLVKSKLSIAEKFKTTAFSRVFHPQKIDNFLRISKLDFWTKNEDFEQCAKVSDWNEIMYQYLNFHAKIIKLQFSSKIKVSWRTEVTRCSW